MSLVLLLSLHPSSIHVGKDIKIAAPNQTKMLLFSLFFLTKVWGEKFMVCPVSEMCLGSLSSLPHALVIVVPETLPL